MMVKPIPDRQQRILDVVLVARTASTASYACRKDASSGEECSKCAAEGVQRVAGRGAPFNEQLATCSVGTPARRRGTSAPSGLEPPRGFSLRLEGCKCCSFRASCCCQTRKYGLAATIMHQWRTSASTFRPPGSLLLRSSTRRSSACNALRVEEFVWQRADFPLRGAADGPHWPEVAGSGATGRYLALTAAPRAPIPTRGRPSLRYQVCGD